MSRDVRWPREAWIPLLAGLFWLWRAPEHGFWASSFSVVPGCLLLGSGFSMLLMPGDRRIAQFAALGGALGVVFALPAFVVVGPGAALLLIAASLAGFVAAGVRSVRARAEHRRRTQRGVLATRSRPRWPVDEALLATMLLTREAAARAAITRASRGSCRGARRSSRPRAGSRSPPTITGRRLPSRRRCVSRARTRGIDYEHLSFESGYEPQPGEPGRERWLARAANRTAHAWVLRHPGPPRPWLVCIHGYQMGSPLIDLLAFQPEIFHRRLGLNLLVPTLPLHGRASRAPQRRRLPRRRRARHAPRRGPGDVGPAPPARLGAARQEAPGIGVLGLSLGGYNAALLASLRRRARVCDRRDSGRGLHASDVPAPPPLHLRSVEPRRVEPALRDVLRVVSPLALEPPIRASGAGSSAAVADRLVPADQVRDLWRHWERPRIVWYPGSHLTFRLHRNVAKLVLTALVDSGLIGLAELSRQLRRGARSRRGSACARRGERVPSRDRDGEQQENGGHERREQPDRGERERRLLIARHAQPTKPPRSSASATSATASVPPSLRRNVKKPM